MELKHQFLSSIYDMQCLTLNQTIKIDEHAVTSPIPF